ncbi:MAG: hypothetical protein AAGC93_03815, partial [Cyanobacteria bacterium P01_F01_bin.53]
MPAFDKLRNELDKLRGKGLSVNNAFHKLVKKYHKNAKEREGLLYIQEQLEREGHPVTWPSF